MAPRLRWYHTLAWRFFLRTAAALVLIMGVALWVAYDQAHKGAQAAGQLGLRTAAQVLERQFSQEARILDSGLDVFITPSSNVSYLDEAIRRQNALSVQDYLQQSLEDLKAELAVLVRPDGRCFASTAEGGPEDYRDITIAQMALDPEAALEAGRPGPSYTGFLEMPGGSQRGMYFAVARPIRLPGGSIIGALLVGRRLGDAFAGTLRDLASGRMQPLAHLAILSHSRLAGATASATQLPDLSRELSSSAFRMAEGEVAQGRRSQAIPVKLQGVRYLAMLSPLRGEDGATLAMSTLFLVPIEPYFAPFRKIQHAILGTGAAGILLALLVGLGSARRVTSPLRALTLAAATLARGERPELPPQDSPDEVGLLSRAFRSLLSELRAKDELLAALAHLKPASTQGDLGEPTGAAAQVTEPEEPDVTALLSGTVPHPSEGREARIDIRVGTVFAERYRIESVLGKGGMGVVLKARDLRLDEDVALKIIRPERGATQEFLAQLKQEIKLARRISHRNVLRTHDFGEHAGVPFVSMEYLKGVTLKQLLDDRGQLPLPLVLRIGRQMAEGLEAAHAEGVVHRDVKPLNVIFDHRGDVKLLDFGLAAPVAAPGSAQAGYVFGTPRYMAPEQVRGEQADPRTDLYALGVLLFELAVGTPPFDHSEISALLEMHLHEPVPRLRTRVPQLPESFARLVEQLLSKQKEDRPASAAEVIDALKRVSAEGERAWAG